MSGRKRTTTLCENNLNQQGECASSQTIFRANAIFVLAKKPRAAQLTWSQTTSVAHVLVSDRWTLLFSPSLATARRPSRQPSDRDQISEQKQTMKGSKVT